MVPSLLLQQLRQARDLADRHYAEPLDLEALAAAAHVSRYHFGRCFAETYGETPMRYLTRRRIERAQDLFRSANLTVTEVCMLVGFSSLGSLSSRFRELVGESPTAYRDRWAARGGPHIPGCFLFMRGVDRWQMKDRNLGEASRPTDPQGARMITNVSLATVWVNDQDEAKAFYVDKLGFREGSDVAMGDGYRWVTVIHADHPEMQLTLMRPGPPLDDEDAAAFRRMLDKGSLGAVGLATDDCHQTYEELSAKGVTYVQEPADRPYGVEAIQRDNSGNWLVLVEPKPFNPADFASGA